ncbi:hypothetical protein [Terracidiphilus sp.]|jgi:hypothetical protein|uniref:hypothetical protein n=1 Tax=Terracidiphilus sp. TaxID=1964191 RepID=UPI003C1C9CC1
MSNTPQLFNNISPAQFAVLQQKAGSAGIPISGNSGSASKMGVEVAWNYSPDSQQLSIECLKAPFFISASDVNQKIHDLVTETLTTT